MIVIKKSPTADTRTCDFTRISKETLQKSTLLHMNDVMFGIRFFQTKLGEAALNHDIDKLDNLDAFHADFLTGFKEHSWWDNHRKVTRHHLLSDDGVPTNVNLIDILEMVADCVMAGMARSGSVYPLEIKPEVLMDAFKNTVEMLKNRVVVMEAQ